MQHYIQLAYDELCKEDGLTVMGRGLGITLLYTKFVQYYCMNTGQKRLVLCLNANGSEDLIKDVALSEGANPLSLPKIIDNEVNSQERGDMYNEGGCFFITSRILIVDLLDNKIDPELITGLLIFNAHKISETSIESFVIRVYKERNKNGFVKAFCEDPETLQYSGKLERLMTLLFVKKLYLWPRFRSQVDSYLQTKQPEVIELSQPLTASMQSIQSALLLALKTCLSELKKSAPQLESAASAEEAPTLTLENGLFESFDTMIRSRLDADWHRISWRAKQLVADLSTLRKLLDYLIRYDAFSFYYLLLKLQAASSEQQSPSLWLTSEAANHIFKQAKERVYKVIPFDTSFSSASSASSTSAEESPEEFKQVLHKALQLEQTIVPVLECPPKWKLLLDIVKEIKSDYRKQQTTGAIASSSLSDAQGGRVLLIVKDHLTSTQLRDVIVNGEACVMDMKYRGFVSQQVQDIRRTVVAKSRSSSSSSSSSSSGTGATGSLSSVRAKPRPGTGEGELIHQADLEVQHALHGTTSTDSLLASAAGSAESGDGAYDLKVPLADLKGLSVETKLLVLQEKLLRMTPAAAPHQQVAGSSDTLASSVSEAMKGSDGLTLDADELQQRNEDEGEGDESSRLAAPSKSSSRKRGAVGSAATATTSAAQSKKKRAKVSLTSSAGASNAPVIDLINTEEGDEKKDGAESEEDSDTELRLKVSMLDPDLHITVITHAQAQESYTLLADHRPTCIILYDPEVSIIRAVELYQANTETPLKLYFLLYEGSAEEHRYVGSLAKEKKAFENLLTLKKHTVIALPDNPADKAAMSSDLRMMSMDTRTQFRGRLPPCISNEVRQIVVDVREFRSTLPSKLHYSNFHLVPRTIYVGDYVLSTEICVERKGISDLFQSFASGRLYNQARSMTKHYKYPCLLIEFSPDKPFSLIGRDEIPSDIQQNSIISKLTLLAQSFPTLRFLWSRSPTHTVEIFREIVFNHVPVDVVKAVTVGALSEAGKDGNTDATADGGVAEAEAMLTAQEILLSLPGINLQNFRDVMNNVENIAELSKLSVAQLTPLIGPINATKLYTFFRQRRMA